MISVLWIRKILATGVITSLLLVLGFVAVRLWQLKTDADTELCFENDPDFVPVIADFGPDHLVLNGSGTMLRVGESYSYNVFKDYPHVDIRLIDLNTEEAVFMRYTEYPDGNEDGHVYPGQKLRCKLIVARDDPKVLPRFDAVLIQPSDFSQEWTVTSYTEYLQAHYRDVQPADQTNVDIYVSRSVNYWIGIGLDRYENEESAVKAAVDFDLDRITAEFDRSFIASRASEYAEGCTDLHQICVFYGRYGRYWISVYMHVQTGPVDYYPGPTISPQDWYALMKLVNDRLISATLP